MSSFLDCNIWIIPDIDHTEDYFYPVYEVFKYNSNTDNFSMYMPGSIIVPEFEIENLHLLEGLDFDLINKNRIYLIKRENTKWSIDLKYYDTYSRSKDI